MSAIVVPGLPDPWDLAADIIDPPVHPFAADPKGFIEANLREWVWSGQDNVCLSVLTNRRTAVPAGHNLGKSHIVSRLAKWWLETHPIGDAFVVTTAPTFHQVRSILWRYIGQAHRKAEKMGNDSLGKVLQTEWWVGPELVGFGRKPADWNPDAIQGIHAPHVLVIVDEASGIPSSIWDSLDSLISNEGSRIIAIGNPRDPGSKFAQICKPDSGWNVIRLDAYDSPNMTDEYVPPEVGRMLVSRVWIEEKRQEWGEESPMFKAKVRGIFPDDADDAVVPWTWALRCQDEMLWDDTDLLPVELGVDIGGGGDETVCQERRGPVAGRQWKLTSNDPNRTAKFVIAAINESEATLVKIDSNGLGWGVAGQLDSERKRSHQARIMRVNWSIRSAQPRVYVNLRSQIWWEVGRELSRQQGWDLSECGDDLIGQLTATKYDEDSSGRIRIEPKEETVKRLGRSPDEADALLLAYYTPRRRVMKARASSAA